MSQKIPCEVVRDLFPSYIDKLTSETSNHVIEEHLRECEPCRQVLSSMTGTGTLEKNAEDERGNREIDFLRKNRKRNRRIMFGSIAGALFLVLAVLMIRTFLIGNGGYTNWAAMRLQVDGQNVSFEAAPMDSASAISGLSFTEDGGIVTVKARSVLASPIHPGSMKGTYTAKSEIHEVRIGERIIWSEGATVSVLASDLFKARHSYIGDMSANACLAAALNLGSYLGPFTNELETEEEPYGWKILLSEEIDRDKLAQKKQDMDAFGRVLVGLIDNLDHVTFVYNVNGEEQTQTITAADASDFFGANIKTCGKDIHALDTLITKTGLSMYALSGSARDSENNTDISLRIMNGTDRELFSVSCTYYKDGVMCSESYMQNADNSAMKPGTIIWMNLFPEDFGGRVGSSMDADSVLELEISFSTPDGKQIHIPERLRVTADSRTAWEFTLTGNDEEGYQITQ